MEKEFSNKVYNWFIRMQLDTVFQGNQFMVQDEQEGDESKAYTKN